MYFVVKCILQTTDLFIENGRLDRDKYFLSRCMFFYNNNGASTEDYLLKQFNILKPITSFKIQPPNEFTNFPIIVQFVRLNEFACSCQLCFCVLDAYTNNVHSYVCIVFISRLFLFLFCFIIVTGNIFHIYIHFKFC